jgi:DNA-binding HxlR family transcriptional regulator
MRPGELTYAEKIEKVIELLEGKWTIQILCSMRDGPVRLSQLRRMIPTASKKGLTASLRSLEITGLVVRRDLSHSVLHVEYDLAETTRDRLCALLNYLANWSSQAQ